MDMSSPMATGSSRLVRRPATWSSGGAHPSEYSTMPWHAWANRGHRLWAAMPAAFWVYVYKVHRCPQLGCHDWTACPYAHKGERARRRDPRRFSYLVVACPAFRDSQARRTTPACARGLRCRYAHGVFELWLHPTRFRTVLCEAGEGCRRRICFFAHSGAELRAEDDPVPLMSPPLLSPTPLTFPRRVDLAMQAVPAGKVYLFNSGAATSGASSSSYNDPASAVADDAVAPDDREDPVADRRASEDMVDYPHFDLIRDMVDW